MNNVVNLPCVTRHDLPAERILQDALDAGLDGVVVMGYKDGEPYFGSTYADGGNVMWLMELMRAKLLKIAGELAGRD